jgi:hypothetical protein
VTNFGILRNAERIFRPQLDEKSLFVELINAKDSMASNGEAALQLQLGKALMPHAILPGLKA